MFTAFQKPLPFLVHGTKLLGTHCAFLIASHVSNEGLIIGFF